MEFDDRNGNVVIDKFAIVIKQANEPQEVNEAIAFIEFLDKNFDNVMKRMQDLFHQMVVYKMEFEHSDFEKWKQEERKLAAAHPKLAGDLAHLPGRPVPGRTSHSTRRRCTARR